MDNKQFNIRIKPLNVEYMQLFGYIPCITDYSCSREEYIRNLERAVEDHRELTSYLEKLYIPSNVEI